MAVCDCGISSYIKCSCGLHLCMYCICDHEHVTIIKYKLTKRAKNRYGRRRRPNQITFLHKYVLMKGFSDIYYNIYLQYNYAS